MFEALIYRRRTYNLKNIENREMKVTREQEISEHLENGSEGSNRGRRSWKSAKKVTYL
jgi:hypothetical protein